MRKYMALSIIAGLVLFASDAQARAVRQRHHQYVKHFYHHRHLATRHYRRIRHYVRAPGGMPGPCYTAASMGGPCGCFAEWIAFHITNHVWRGWNLWLADEWRHVFPQTSPAPGMAAVWPHRHVAIIAAVQNDRTGKPVSITTRESWGLTRRSVAGLVIVDPYFGASRPRVRYTSGSLG